MTTNRDKSLSSLSAANRSSYGTAGLHDATVYLRWRTRIYSTICHCYEDMAFKPHADKAKLLASAEAVVERAQEKLAELIALEEEDPPLPKSFVELTDEIRCDMNILLFKYKAIAAPKEVPK